LTATAIRANTRYQPCAGHRLRARSEILSIRAVLSPGIQAEAAPSTAWLEFPGKGAGRDVQVFRLYLGNSGFDDANIPDVGLSFGTELVNLCTGGTPSSAQVPSFDMKAAQRVAEL
jgi:hypothetical protein